MAALGFCNIWDGNTTLCVPLCEATTPADAEQIYIFMKLNVILGVYSSDPGVSG